MTIQTIRVRRFDVLWLVGLTAVAAFAFGLLVATPDRAQIQNPGDLLPACTTEDSRNCYWNAKEHGNGRGTNFIDIAGVTYYPSSDSAR